MSASARENYTSGPRPPEASDEPSLRCKAGDRTRLAFGFEGLGSGPTLGASTARMSRSAPIREPVIALLRRGTELLGHSAGFGY
jgi:hypothetical protein